MAQVAAGDLSVGEYIRSPKGHKKIYVVKEKRPSSSVLVWRYDSVKRVDMENDFMFLQWNQRVERVQI